MSYHKMHLNQSKLNKYGSDNSSEEGKNLLAVDALSCIPVISEHPTWSDIPPELKEEIGLLLLKPSIKQPDEFLEEQITEQQKIDHLLSDRKNMDILYPDRSLDERFKYLKMPWIEAYDCFSRSGEIGFFSRHMGNSCASEVAAISSCPFVLVLSIFGLFVDCGRAVKRKCDDSEDEKLHREIVGPSSQIMK
jgi:hypothetical protein